MGEGRQVLLRHVAESRKCWNVGFFGKVSYLGVSPQEELVISSGDASPHYSDG
jgi:hypothetical protein